MPILNTKTTPKDDGIPPLNREIVHRLNVTFNADFIA